MLSRAQSKYIRSLSKQKFRSEYGVFTAEGEKIAREWLAATGPVLQIIATDAWASANRPLIQAHPEAELSLVTESELDDLSGLKTAHQVLLVLPVPASTPIPVLKQWYLALDDIQDPGNMGTIIRIADWFGIPGIVCSPECVDIYNAKVIQSAMGSHLRVTVYESNLVPFLESISLPRMAATLQGVSVYGVEQQDCGVLIIGNEARGISAEVLACADREISIPRKGGAESLNAAVATGILCALLTGR